MKKYTSSKLAIALLLSLASSQVMAVGALAIDDNQGSRYGFSYDYDNTYDARNRALSECGSGCTVVVDFDSGCAAYAADQTAGSSVYGWGQDSTESRAKNRALSECAGHGGSNCVIRVWGCNSR
ncbi:hypothetical protein DOJK_00449 [Patescibacteria group bacterium]|nr:hypothetical protein DOJK_00449 [Patescibacteria group bacterium]